MAEETEGPGAVWKLILRADDLVKYAQNRDPKTAYAQARELLERAADMVVRLPNGPAADALSTQIERRLQDLKRLEDEA